MQALREAGWSDDEIFTMTAFVALRLAFSTVNGALGARPDAALRSRRRSRCSRPSYGRPIAD